MSVFISHRTADNSVAEYVANRLKNHHGISVYVDDIDHEAGQLRGTAAITALLVRRINMCTNLLAIISLKTAGSWWVPFEIGVASSPLKKSESTERSGPGAIANGPRIIQWPLFQRAARQAPRVISTLTDQNDASLPEYLLEWPRLRGDAAIDTFARLYKAQETTLTEQIVQNRATPRQQFVHVDRFHASLKNALGQQ